MTQTASTTAEIIRFPLQPLAPNRLSTRDRIALLHWEEQSYTQGFSRMRVDTSAPPNDGEVGDYVALYRGDCGWAAWCIGCARGGFAIWRSGSGQTIGWYPQLAQAFAAIFAADPAR